MTYAQISGRGATLIGDKGLRCSRSGSEGCGSRALVDDGVPSISPLAKANLASEVRDLRFGGSCSIETKDARITEVHTAMNNEAGVGSRGAGIENGLSRKSLVRSGSIENLDAGVIGA